MCARVCACAVPCVLSVVSHLNAFARHGLFGGESVRLFYQGNGGHLALRQRPSLVATQRGGAEEAQTKSNGGEQQFRMTEKMAGGAPHPTLPPLCLHLQMTVAEPSVSTLVIRRTLTLHSLSTRMPSFIIKTTVSGSVAGMTMTAMLRASLRVGAGRGRGFVWLAWRWSVPPWTYLGAESGIWASKGETRGGVQAY